MPIFDIVFKWDWQITIYDVTQWKDSDEQYFNTYDSNNIEDIRVYKVWAIQSVSYQDAIIEFAKKMKEISPNIIVQLARICGFVEVVP